MTRLAQQIIFRTILGIAFIVVLVSLIAYARGYRFDLSQRELDSTGIIVASSFPNAANIYLNGELFGATNENIIIEPGTYDVEITKDGYTSWRKQLTVRGELVVKADALLFPRNPSLSPVTSLGVVNVVTSSSNDRVMFMSQTGDEEKDGIYVLESSRNPLSSVNQAKLLVPKTSLPFSADLSQTTVEFSPDEREAIVSIYSGVDEDASENAEPVLLGIYLLNIDETTEQPFSITPSVQTIRTAWEVESAELLDRKIQTFKKALPEIITASFDVIAFSPDEEKILYRATETTTLPLIIEPRLIATNQTEETRTINQGDIYVYDSTEDKNFRILGQDENYGENLFWYIDNAHLVRLRPDEDGNLTRIAISDYDGTNLVDVYTGPFEQEFLGLTRDGKLLILTNFNARSGELPDIYTVGIR